MSPERASGSALLPPPQRPGPPQSSGCHPRYLYYSVSTERIRSEFRSYPTGGATPTMTEGRIGSPKIAVPDLSTQHSIVEYLDRETAEIDAAIADAKEAIELSKERSAALISAAVTGKIDVRNHVTAELGAA